MQHPLTTQEQQLLLKLARTAMEAAVRRAAALPVDLNDLPPRLREIGASFVTLTIRGDLRGCIGALEPTQPLALDVCEHAVAAALQDPRFMPVRPDELASINIEVSRLTLPEELNYSDAASLLDNLRPGIHGVILRDGGRRATFLPQVWDKIPDKAAFLNQLCAKMGVMPDTWRQGRLRVQTYQVEEFHE